jgi:tetratricopeptide (TPR) repeat protein
VKRFLPAFLIVTAGIVAYHNSFSGPFIFDDLATIPSNPHIRHLWPPDYLYEAPSGDTTLPGRPLLGLSLALNFSWFGLEVRGYHLFNFFVHLLAVCALYGVLRRTLEGGRLAGRYGERSAPFALIVALLWTVHPLQTESVTYVIQRAESMGGLFYLLTLYAFIRGWFVPSVFCCALGVAAKEVVATAPLAVLLYDRVFIAGSFREALRGRGRYYAGLASTWLLLGALVLHAGILPQLLSGTSVEEGIVSGWERSWIYLRTEPGVLLHYLKLSLWPHPLCLDYRWPPAEDRGEVAFPGLIVFGSIVLTLWGFRRRPEAAFCGAWFFLVLSPTSSVLPLADYAFEHRMYLPLAGVIVLTVGVGERGFRWLAGRLRLEGWKTLVSGTLISVLAVGGLTWLTVRRNEDYRSSISIWTDTVEKRPENDRAHYNVGVVLRDAGRLEEAAKHLGASISLNPGYVKAYNQLGNIFFQKENLEGAQVCYKQALQVDDRCAEAYSNLGLIRARSGALEEAVGFYQKALAIDPDQPDALNNWGVLLLQQRDPEGAREKFREAIAAKPDYAEAYHNLGDLIWREGRAEEAIRQFEEAVRLKPDFAPARAHLAIVWIQAGRGDAAREHLEEAVRLGSGEPEVYYFLGNERLRESRFEEAADLYRRTLAGDAAHLDARNNLGVALLRLGRGVEAADCFEAVLRADPDHAGVRGNLDQARGMIMKGG